MTTPLNLFTETIDSEKGALQNAAQQLAIKFSDESEIPAKYKNTGKKTRQTKKEKKKP